MDKTEFISLRNTGLSQALEPHWGMGHEEDSCLGNVRALRLFFILDNVSFSSV